jgi:hypothetical protein
VPEEHFKTCPHLPPSCVHTEKATIRDASRSPVNSVSVSR